MLGKVVWLGALAAMSETSGFLIEEQIHALERREMLRRERRSSVGGEVEYAFRHVLMRDVAYGQIPRAQRAEKHRRAAEWIESLSADRENAPDMLAHHYSQALDYARESGQPTAELERQTRLALREAAERAAALNSITPAQRHYVAALALWPEDDPEWPVLVVAAADIGLGSAGEEWTERLRRASDRLAASGDLANAARAEMQAAFRHWNEGMTERAIAAFERSRDLLRSTAPSPNVAYVTSRLAVSAALRGDFEVAIELCEAALAIADTSVCSAGTVVEYTFRNLRLEGSFQLRDEHCPCDGAIIHIRVAGDIWIRQGGILAGNTTNKLTRCTLRISLLEPNWTIRMSWDRSQNARGEARSLILESGMLLLNGPIPSPMFARLAVTATVGSTSLQMDRDIGWRVGDTIVIAGTQRREMYTKAAIGDDIVALGINQRERRVITAISSDKRAITIDTPLLYEHFGTPGATLDGSTYQIGAEVAVLNRNIIIDGGATAGITDIAPLPKYNGGWALAVGCTLDNYQGCATFADSGWPMSPDKPGYLRVEGVWMRDPGQGGLPHGAIDLDGLMDQQDAALSFFTYNVIERALNSALMIRHTTNGLRVENNLIIDPQGDGITAMGKNNTIVGNLIIGTDIPMQCEHMYDIIQQCRTAASGACPPQHNHGQHRCWSTACRLSY